MTSLAQAPDNTISGLPSNITGTTAEWIERKVADWTNDLKAIARRKKADLGRASGDSLGDTVEGGSATCQTGLKGGHANIQGHPIWAAVKGAWAGGGAVVRAAIEASVLATILLLVLSPVLLIVFLLSLPIIAALHRAMRARHH